MSKIVASFVVAVAWALMAPADAQAQTVTWGAGQPTNSGDTGISGSGTFTGNPVDGVVTVDEPDGTTHRFPVTRNPNGTFEFETSGQGWNPGPGQHMVLVILFYRDDRGVLYPKNSGFGFVTFP